MPNFSLPYPTAKNCGFKHSVLILLCYKKELYKKGDLVVAEAESGQ